MNWIRDLAVVLLAVEAFFIALVPLALLGGLVYGLWWLLRHENLPSWLGVVHAYLSLAQAYIELAMQTLTSPILRDLKLTHITTKIRTTAVNSPYSSPVST